jgi:UDP-glucose 4-epimerase
MAQTILVTGATGYIGSHTCVCLLKAGWQVIALDNLSNSSPHVIARIEKICACSLPFYHADVRDLAALRTLLQQHTIDAAIHFAGFKAVGESVSQPLDYFDNNVGGSITLVRALAQHGVKMLVFSSSATVYGEPQTVPIPETAPLSVTNPYGRTKLVTEQMLADLARSDTQWRIATLRYFNPAGAHESGLLGEDPRGVPNNLMPYVAQVAIGRRQHLSIFGDDYPTADGTGVRDYIHVMDLARGHLAALRRLFAHVGCFTVNLGTGQGVSVLQAVRAFEQASGRRIAVRVAARRPGDVASCYASPAAAQQLLDWQAEKNLLQMCEDQWRWQSTNPDGYSS